MSGWTGLDFGAAWPFLAVSYALFFALLGFGALSLRWQHRQLRRQELVLTALEARRNGARQEIGPENDNRKTAEPLDPKPARPAEAADADLRAQDP